MELRKILQQQINLYLCLNWNNNNNRTKMKNCKQMNSMLTMPDGKMVWLILFWSNIYIYMCIC